MSGDSTDDGVNQVPAEYRQIAELLALIQKLTSQVVRAESASELFTSAFAALFRLVPFDVATAVMIEQNLDLFVTARQNARSVVGDALIARIRARLEELIPLSFASTEVVVQSEAHELPAGDGTAGLREDVVALVEQEQRTAGLLLVGREAPAFTEREKQVLAIFATQVSMLLDTIHARERIGNLADTDDLTGIWNRRYFRRQLASEVERARTFGVPLSLIFFDIDEFKQINDGLGHVVGDVVLSELCGAVREMLRPTDTLARFGGDEFAIILPHTDLHRATLVAGRLLDCVRGLTIPTDEEGAVQCSISAGVAQLGPDDTAAADLIRRADDRLYVSKRQGKNRYTA